MDSSDLQNAILNTNPANSSRKEQPKISMVISSERVRFLQTYRPHQNWSFPDSVVYYIVKNPSSSSLYQQLIETCKYFFIKNPILVVDDLEHYGDKTCFIWLGEENIRYNVSSKLWLTDLIDVNSLNEENRSSNGASFIIPHIYQCDATEVEFQDQIISFNDFLLFCLNAKQITLLNAAVKNEDDTVIAFEKLVEALPKLKTICFDVGPTFINISSKTMTELLKIKHFKEMDKVRLSGITGEFDIETFYTYMKQNKHTEFCLIFDDEIVDDYKKRLEEIVDEILETKDHDYKVVDFDYPGFDNDKWYDLKAYYK